MIGSYKRFVFTIGWIDEEKETAIGILQFGQEICFPFGFLHQIADAITALGNSQIVQRSYSGQGIHRKHQVVNQAGAVNRVLAVIARIMMPAGGINRSLLYEWE